MCVCRICSKRLDTITRLISKNSAHPWFILHNSRLVESYFSQNNEIAYHILGDVLGLCPFLVSLELGRLCVKITQTSENNQQWKLCNNSICLFNLSAKVLLWPDEGDCNIVVFVRAFCMQYTPCKSLIICTNKKKRLRLLYRNILKSGKICA